MTNVHKKKHCLNRANPSLRGFVKLVSEDGGGPSGESCNVLEGNLLLSQAIYAY